MPLPTTFPGVYVEELRTAERTIPGVSTSRTAFIGSGNAGPVDEAVQVLSFADFERQFSGADRGSELSCAVKQFFLNGGSDAWVVRLPHPAADADWLAGLKALEAVDLVNLLVLPGVTSPDAVQAAVVWCEERRVFLILDPPADAVTPQDMLDRVGSGGLTRSKNAAVYFPWIMIPDPSGGPVPRRTPPGGTIAGVFARTDAEVGIWKAPAGLRAVLQGVLGPGPAITSAMNGALNAQGINCLRTSPAGIVAWGARTLAGADALASDWKYVPVRRLALFIEESLFQGTKWAVFEPDDEPLWAQIRRDVGAFMHGLFLQGAFAGTTPQDAYLVRCGHETTTQDDINNGFVNIVVGFAPLKPAEFIFIDLRQRAGQVA